MRTLLPCHLVDVFTDRAFSGNPAGVVLDADGLSDEQMQGIAREWGLAGTGFLLPTAEDGADWRLRWFTPTREVTYSGHTTIAVVQVMMESGRLPTDRVVFSSLVGRLEAVVERRAPAPVIWLLPPLPALRPFTAALPPVAEAVGLRESQIGRWASAALTPEMDLLLPVTKLEPLRALKPDPDRIAALAQRLKLRGICAVSRETVDPTSATHCRFFAPHLGIPEDIVTGSVHSSIAVWLFAAGRLPVIRGHVEFTAEQGDVLGRPGRLQIDLAVEGKTPREVRVGGTAVTVLSGSLRLPGP